MSTNSTIKIKRTDGTETGIYCHNDGYIEGVGTTLQLAYNTAEKVENLLKLGDLSVLGYYTEPKTREHCFESPEENICVAYHRDRGEKFRQSNGDNEYIYTFDETEAVWYVERECYIEGTDAQKFLGIDCYHKKEKLLLLEAIMQCNFGGWDYDEFAAADNVIPVCIDKALEPRREFIRQQQERHEAYYRAYCD